MKKLIKCEKKENSIFSISDPLGVQLLTCLRLQFSHLNEHEFIYGFGDTINAMCACGSEIETTEHFLLRCHLYSPHKLELFEKLEKVDSSFLNLNIKDKVSLLLYGSQSATSKSSNHEILKGHLRYKTIISQNVSSEAQIKNFFISQKNYVLYSRYSSFCIFSHPMI